MSAFLGPIHHWLYNKVLWHEALLDEITAAAKDRVYDVDALVQTANEEFGSPVTMPLESVIDGGNIHGWLQNKIESLEYRMAYVTTQLTMAHILSTDELTQIYRNNAQKASQTFSQTMKTPDQVFKAIFDFLLDGMPCDRVNQPLESDENYYKWQKNACLHTPFWSAVGGDIHLYNHLRMSWIESFMPVNFDYEIDSLGQHVIKRSV